MALEKDRYSNLSEGMKSTIGIFTTVLKSNIAKKKFKAYVQPVLPMLTETKPLVTAYNEIYMKEVSKVSGNLLLSACNYCLFYYVNFFYQ